MKYPANDVGHLVFAKEGDYFDRFAAIYSRVLSKIKSASQFLSKLCPDDEENQLNIKMPENASFDEFAKILKDLHFIFNECQALSVLNDKEHVTVKGVDSGSIWLVAIASLPFATAIGILTNIVIKILREKHENQKFIDEARIRMTNVENAESNARLVKSIEEAIDAKLKLLSETYAKEFIDETEGLKEKLEYNYNQEIVSLTTAIDMYTKLHQIGVSIHPSLEAPKEVVEKFPTKEDRDYLTEVAKIFNLPIHKNDT